MKRGLQDALRGKKFLLVLDDICDNESGGVRWKDMKALLNVCAKGSKILITRRNKSVSLHIGSIYVHQLNALSHSDSMSLFIWCSWKDPTSMCQYSETTCPEKRQIAQVPESKLRFDKLRTFVFAKGNFQTPHQPSETKYCSKLWALPEFTAYELRELKIQGCPELSKRCTQDSGADWPKIARVPKVEIDGVKLMMNNEGRYK